MSLGKEYLGRTTWSTTSQGDETWNISDGHLVHESGTVTAMNEEQEELPAYWNLEPEEGSPMAGEQMRSRNTMLSGISTTRIREVPWQYFLATSMDATAHFCAAVAINRRFLLSSQSCLRAFDDLVNTLDVYPTFPSDAIRQQARITNNYAITTHQGVSRP